MFDGHPENIVPVDLEADVGLVARSLDLRDVGLGVVDLCFGCQFVEAWVVLFNDGEVVPPPEEEVEFSLLLFVGELDVGELSILFTGGEVETSLYLAESVLLDHFLCFCSLCTQFLVLLELESVKVGTRLEPG